MSFDMKIVPSLVTYAITELVMVVSLVVFFAAMVFLFLLCIYTAVRRRRFTRLPDASHHPNPSAAKLPTNGLAPEILESLPIVIYTLENPNDDEECSVCLCEFKAGDKARFLPNCKHSFHTECIDVWFHSHINCPICRADVVQSEASLKPDEAHENSTNSNSTATEGGGVVSSSLNGRDAVIVGVGVEEGQTSGGDGQREVVAPPPMMESPPDVSIDVPATRPVSISSVRELEEIRSDGLPQSSSTSSRLHAWKSMLGRGREAKAVPTPLRQNEDQSHRHSQSQG